MDGSFLSLAILPDRMTSHQLLPHPIPSYIISILSKHINTHSNLSSPQATAQQVKKIQDQRTLFYSSSAAVALVL